MRMLCAKAGLAIAASAAAAQVGVIPAEVLIQSGDVVQDFNGTSYPITAAASPVTNASGKVVFTITTPGGTGTVRGIVTNRSGFMQLVALQGQPIAPNSSDPTRLWGSFSSVGLFIADNGRLVLGATASPAFPLGSGGRWGVITSDEADQWTITGATGLPFPGDPSQTYTGPILQSAAQVDTGLVGFAVRVGTDSYYFLKESDAGLGVVDALPPGPLLQSPNQPSLTSSGSFVYSGQQIDQPYHFIRGQFAGGLTTVSLLNEPSTFLNAPGTWRLGPDGDILSGNAAGELLFTTWLVDPLNASAPPLYALVRSSSAGLVLLAKVGDPVPGYPGLVWRNLSTSNGSLSDSGEAEWEFSVDGPGVTSSNMAVLVRFSAGPSPTMKLIARQGDPVADLPGYRYSQTFVGAMTRGGRLLFSNSVLTADNSPHIALFAVDAAGASRAVVVEGASVVNIPGLGGRTVTGTTGVAPTGGNDGQKRSVTEDGRIVVRILHSTGSAIALLDIPCGADVGVGGGTSGYDGRLDNNDFIAFISLFFAADRRADRGIAGGLPGSDGQFDNNDFIAFINEFFAGC